MQTKNLVPFLAAAILTLAVASPALADGGSGSSGTGTTVTTGSGEHSGSGSKETKPITGTISAVSSTSITVGSTAYNFASSVVVKFHDHTLTTADIPTNVTAKVFLDSSGNVDKVVLESDPNMPTGESYSGTVGTVTQTTIQVDSYTLNLATDVTVKYHDRTLPIADVTSGLTVKVVLDSQGNVKTIKITNDPSIPKGESTEGTISAISATSITIGSYTLAVSPNVEVKFHDHVLTVADVPTGVDAKVKIDSNLTVTKIILKSDPNLPNGNSASGTISAVSATSITIGTYTLPVSSSVTVKYHGFQLTIADVPTGAQAKVKIDSQSGEVTKIKLQTDPNLPSSHSVSGSVTAVTAATIALDGYTLNVDPSAQISYQGQAEQLSAIQAGWTVKVHLDSQGTVDQIDIQSGPTSNQSGSQSSSSSGG